jgi:hypothetical protein
MSGTVPQLHYLGYGRYIWLQFVRWFLHRTDGRLIAAAGSRQEKRVAPFHFSLFNALLI